jgi:hypothetical protein
VTIHTETSLTAELPNTLFNKIGSYYATLSFGSGFGQETDKVQLPDG